MRFTPTDAAVLTDVIRALCVMLLLAVAGYGVHCGAAWARRLLREARCRRGSEFGTCDRAVRHPGPHAVFLGDRVWFAWTRASARPIGYVWLCLGFVRPLDTLRADLIEGGLLRPVGGGWYHVGDRCPDPAAAMARLRAGGGS